MSFLASEQKALQTLGINTPSPDKKETGCKQELKYPLQASKSIHSEMTSYSYASLTSGLFKVNYHRQFQSSGKRKSYQTQALEFALGSHECWTMSDHLLMRAKECAGANLEYTLQ